jgi:hypothetical protein
MTASRTAVWGSPSGPRPRGVAWVSTTLPEPSPSTMRMTIVRGSGLVNSATTGAEPADPERDGDKEPVDLVGDVLVDRRVREHLESRKRIRVKPRSVPRIHAIGDDVARLAYADKPCNGV